MKNSALKQQIFRFYRDAEKKPLRLYKEADRLRQEFFGNKVELCSIINAKSGNCSQDCAFCAQSVHHKTDIASYPLVSAEKIAGCAKSAAGLKACAFGIVTSGGSIDENGEFSEICDAIRRIKKDGLVNPDVSLGTLNSHMARRLKGAGLLRYHHNLETSEKFFPNICGTHSYKDRIATIKIAKEAGLGVCCGGLFGLGESIEDRIDFVFALKELDVDAVPLNFFIPVKGTPLETAKPLKQEEILMTIALFRMVLPDKHIKVCGGRELNLKNRQEEIFSAGASGMMIGGYLTQGGRPPEDDLKMLDKLGLVPL